MPWLFVGASTCVWLEMTRILGEWEAVIVIISRVIGRKCGLTKVLSIKATHAIHESKSLFFVGFFFFARCGTVDLRKEGGGCSNEFPPLPSLPTQITCLLFCEANDSANYKLVMSIGTN